MSIEKLIAAIPSQSKAQREQMRVNAGSRLVSGTHAQQADAAAMLAALDAIETREHDGFLGEMKGMEVAERIYRAFTDIPMTDTDAKVLQALLDNPGSSSGQLSTVCGWKDKSWHLHFGNMCERRRDYLPAAAVYGDDDTPFWSGIFADLEQGEHPWTWTMKPDVAAALARLGVRAKRAARA